MARIKYDNNKRQEARDLREKGLSYKEIATELGIAKSTAKLWTGNIRLKAEHRQRLYTKGIEAIKNSPNNSRERRKREIEEILKLAKEEVKFPINDDTFKLLGAMLYWAEGDKTKHFSIANSDPLLIKFMVEWMKKVFGISVLSLKAYLNIYPQQNDFKIKRFWSNLTGIPLENFGKSFVKPISSGYKKNNLYYGTIKIRMPKGTNARYRLFGWIKVLLNDFKIDVDTVETKWNKLKTDYKRP